MKKFFTPLILILFSYQMSNAQCGVATNTNYYFNSAADLVFDWETSTPADTFIIQFKEPFDTWNSAFAFSDTVFTSEYIIENVCSVNLSYDWRVISRCANAADTTGTLNFQLECLPPTSVSTTNVLTNSALLSWTPVPHIGMNCTGYALAYRALGAPSWISLGVVYAQSFQLNNLQPSTNYEFCVNQLCIESTSAPIIGQFNTATPPCTPPAAPTVFGSTNSSLNLTWFAPANSVSHQIEYKPSSSSTWTTITTSSSNFFNLTGLTPGTSYDVRVARFCSANNVSSFSPTSTFTTNCVSLNSSIEHIRYIKIKNNIWTSVANAGGYLFCNWNNPPTLAAGTQYSVRVAAGGQVNNANKQEVAVYLDMNNNQIYEPSELIVPVSVHNNTTVRIYNFTVPTTMPIGPSRMRIVMLKQNQTTMSSCPPAGLRGEVEDYTVTIIAPSSLASSNDINAENTMTQVKEELYSSLQSEELNFEGANVNSSLLNLTEEKNPSLIVSPNPSEDWIEINLVPEDVQLLEIRNALGQLVSTETTMKSNKLDITSLPPGQYIVTANLKDGSRLTSKLIKR